MRMKIASSMLSTDRIATKLRQVAVLEAGGQAMIAAQIPETRWGETIPAVPYPSAARLLPESQMGVVAQAIPDPAVNRMVAGTAEPIRGFVTNTS